MNPTTFSRKHFPSSSPSASPAYHRHNHPEQHRQDTTIVFFFLSLVIHRRYRTKNMLHIELKDISLVFSPFFLFFPIFFLFSTANSHRESFVLWIASYRSVVVSCCICLFWCQTEMLAVIISKCMNDEYLICQWWNTYFDYFHMIDNCWNSQTTNGITCYWIPINWIEERKRIVDENGKRTNGKKIGRRAGKTWWRG